MVYELNIPMQEVKEVAFQRSAGRYAVWYKQVGEFLYRLRIDNDKTEV